MNEDEIGHMQPGRELDAAVGEYVLGYVRLKVPPDVNGENGGNEVLVPGGVIPEGYAYPPKGPIALAWFCREWSTNELDALSLLRQLKHRGFYCTITNDIPGDKWGVCILDGIGLLDHSGAAQANELPEAICRAALLATVAAPAPPPQP